MQSYGNLEIIQNKTVLFFDFCNNLCAHYDIMSVVAGMYGRVDNAKVGSSVLFLQRYGHEFVMSEAVDGCFIIRIL